MIVNEAGAAQWGYPLSLWTWDEGLRNKLNSAMYVPSATGTIQAPGQLTFEFADGDVTVRKSFRFDANSYIVRIESSVVRGGNYVTALPAWPFAVCAALSGAKTVHAFEPSREAFSVLLKNIHANKLDSIIVPVNKAVSDHSGEIVRFPHKASPFNSLVMTAGPESKLHVDRFTGDLREHALAMSASLEIEFNEIETVALGDYMSEQGVPSIDLLKMDCEGAEYSIVPSLSKETIDRIVSIRMECHGDSKALMDSFCHDAYMVERASGDELWLLKRHDALSS